MDMRSVELADVKQFPGDQYMAYLQRLLGADFRPLEELDEVPAVNKLCAVYTPESRMRLEEELGGRYEMIFHGAPIMELLPKGLSKAVGIEKVCGLLEIPHEDTYAFGDSANDIEMLRHVKYGIAMGNASAEAKEAADYVTAPLHEDGIWLGPEHFGLI